MEPVEINPIDATACYVRCAYAPWTRKSLREMFVSALAVHWAHPEAVTEVLGDNTLECFSSAPGTEASKKLTVAPLFHLDDERPLRGVYVGISSSRYTKIANGDFSKMSGDYAATAMARAVQLQILMRHVHESKETVELMEAASHLFLHALREHLGQRPDYRGFDPASEGEAVPLEGENPDTSVRMYGADLVWNLTFVERISLRLESHPLKSYALSLNPQS